MQGGDRADHRGHQQRGGRIAQPELLGDQVAGGGTQREGEQDRQPGEPFAAPRVDAVDGQGLLHRVPPGERHRQGEGEDDGGGVQRDPEVVDEVVGDECADHADQDDRQSVDPGDVALCAELDDRDDGQRDPIATEAPVNPKLKWVLRESAAVSATVVARILMV